MPSFRVKFDGVNGLVKAELAHAPDYYLFAAIT